MISVMTHLNSCYKVISVEYKIENQIFLSSNLMSFLKMKTLIIQKIVSKPRKTDLINVFQTILYQIIRTFIALGKLNQFHSFSFYNRERCVSSFSLIFGSGKLTLFIKNNCTFFTFSPFILDLGHAVSKNKHVVIHLAATQSHT